jgi:hypothetical protein
MKEYAQVIRQGKLMNLRHTFVLACAVLVTACGGGGGSSGAAPASSSNSQAASVPTPPVVSAPPPTATADLELAARLYQGDARTPSGFDVEGRPANVAGTVSTRHLKNTDLATGPQAISPIFEICTNDMAQAIDWSERQATWQGQYSDLVEVRSDARLFEVVRVPRAAGSMNQRPLNADELEKLAEYLWQFTIFNNSDYAVESSSTVVSGGNIVQTIRMGQLVRGTAGGCDSVQLVDWTHTMSSTDGSLARSLSNVRSFKVQSSGGTAQACAG